MGLFGDGDYFLCGFVEECGGCYADDVAWCCFEFFAEGFVCVFLLGSL